MSCVDCVAMCLMHNEIIYFLCYGRACIVHYVPKYIEVSSIGIEMQLEGRSEMEMDLFDAVVRRFKELDDGLYGEEERQRWRHFVESDFMVYMPSSYIFSVIVLKDSL